MRFLSPATIIHATLILAATWLAAGCAPAPSYKPQLDALVQRYGLDDAQRESARQAYADWSRENKDLQASVPVGGEAPDLLLRQALLAQRLDGELRRVLNEEQYQEFRRSPGAADPSGLIPVLAQAGDAYRATQMHQLQQSPWAGGQVLLASCRNVEIQVHDGIKWVLSEAPINNAVIELNYRISQ